MEYLEQKIRNKSIAKGLKHANSNIRWEYLYFLLLLTQLAQRRCHSVVTTSLLTLSQRYGMVENETCADVGF